MSTPEAVRLSVTAEARTVEAAPAAVPSGIQRRDRADMLEYLAEMLDGLQGLAQHAGSDTLIGLLRLAHAEAVLEQSRAPRSART